MPLRVTVELIPRGDESRKRKMAVVDITNDGTGTHEVDNYDVRAARPRRSKMQRRFGRDLLA